jgi:hypothetical protein
LLERKQVELEVLKAPWWCVGISARSLEMSTLSLTCSFTIGWLVTLPLWLVALVGGCYSVAAIGDSPVYSAALTEAGILGAEGQSLESPVRYKGHARFEEGGGGNTVRLCALPLLDLTSGYESRQLPV